MKILQMIFVLLGVALLYAHSHALEFELTDDLIKEDPVWNMIKTKWSTPETLNQITTWASVDIDCGVSDMLQFRLARTDNLGPTLLVTMADVHAEIDSFGSDTEFGKVYA